MFNLHGTAVKLAPGPTSVSVVVSVSHEAGRSHGVGYHADREV